MTREVLFPALILPLYVILFDIWCKSQYVINVIINGARCRKYIKDEELFPDTVDTPKKGLEQHRKQEVVKGALSKRKILVIKTMNA